MTEQETITPQSISNDATSSQAPTLDATSESPVAANLEAPADQAAIDPELTKDVRIARALAQATKKERKAAERERQAEAKVRAAEARIQQAEQARDDLNGLLTDAAKNPDKALALLKKAGIPSLDALARLVMQLEPEPESTDKVALRAKQELDEFKAQLAKEKQDAVMAQQKAQYDHIYQTNLQAVSAVLRAAGDEYALVQDNRAEGEILNRAYAFINLHKITDMSPDDETMLIKHFAAEIESELAPQAKTFLERLTKIKKLGIIPNNNIADATGIANQDPNSESLDSVAAKAIAKNKPSKFITNESTVSSKPLPKTYNLGRKDEDAIQQALRAMDGK